MTGENPDPLDAFRAGVLGALDAGGEPGELRAAIRALAPDAELAAWVDTWSDDLTALAVELVQHWATREA